MCPERAAAISRGVQGSRRVFSRSRWNTKQMISWGYPPSQRVTMRHLVIISNSSGSLGSKGPDMLPPSLWSDRKCSSLNGLFAQYLRYAQKIILGISNICLRLFFSHALILNKNPRFRVDTRKFPERLVDDDNQLKNFYFNEISYTKMTLTVN